MCVRLSVLLYIVDDARGIHLDAFAVNDDGNFLFFFHRREGFSYRFEGFHFRGPGRLACASHNALKFVFSAFIIMHYCSSARKAGLIVSATVSCDARFPYLA